MMEGSPAEQRLVEQKLAFVRLAEVPERVVEVDLSREALKGRFAGWEAVFETLQTYTGKVALKMRDQDLDDRVVLQLAAFLGSPNTNVVELDVSVNPRVSENSLKKLAEAVALKATIRILRMEGVAGGHLAKEALLNAMIDNHGLLEVDLGVICNRTFISLATKLAFLPQIRSLSFAEGSLTRPRLSVHSPGPRRLPRRVEGPPLPELPGADRQRRPAAPEPGFPIGPGEADVGPALRADQPGRGGQPPADRPGHPRRREDVDSKGAAGFSRTTFR